MDEQQDSYSTYLLPGFVDAHVHVESSMLVPSEFARAAVLHGTVATVSDPHEIANVLGVPGVEYMLQNAAHVPFKFAFGAPACVPATPFETAGAELTVDDVSLLLDNPKIGYLSEMMDYPGVLNGETAVHDKIAAAQQRGKPVDGHAPGLRGEAARQYFAAGISTDHECFTRQEAIDKLQAGANILIREGSAARNFDELYPLIDRYPDACMLCSDDKHPDDLLAGHIDQLVGRAVQHGVQPMHVLRAACINPVRHYGLNVGLLRPGDDADLIEVNDLTSFQVLRTFIRGVAVAEHGVCRITRTPVPVVNNFNANPIGPEALKIPCDQNSARVHVMQAVDGQLITHRTMESVQAVDGQISADPARDLLKLVVLNRYAPSQPAVALVKGFGLQRGAIASSVAHDSHNVIAVGSNDDDLAAAMNLVVGARGGLSVAAAESRQLLSLPVAGLMSTETCEQVAAAYGRLDRLAKSLGCTLRSPYMTLSFMALLVIPELKLSDQGLFDVQRFDWQPLLEMQN